MRHGSVARCCCIAAHGEQEHSAQKKRAIKREISPRSLQTKVKEQIPTGKRERGCGDGCTPVKSRLQHRLPNPHGFLICECGHRWTKTMAGYIPQAINACPMPGPGWGMNTSPPGAPGAGNPAPSGDGTRPQRCFSSHL